MTNAATHSEPPSTETRLSALLSADAKTLSRVDAVLFQLERKELEIHKPLTVADTARMLGKSRGTIHRWLNTGTIKAIRIEGGNRLIPFNEVARLAGAEK